MTGLDPGAYLRDVLARIADYRINRIGALLADTRTSALLDLPTSKPLTPRERSKARLAERLPFGLSRTIASSETLTTLSGQYLVKLKVSILAA